MCKCSHLNWEHPVFHAACGISRFLQFTTEVNIPFSVMCLDVTAGNYKYHSSTRLYTRQDLHWKENALTVNYVVKTTSTELFVEDLKS